MSQQVQDDVKTLAEDVTVYKIIQNNEKYAACAVLRAKHTARSWHFPHTLRASVLLDHPSQRSS